MFTLLTSVEDNPNKEFSKEIVCHLSQLQAELMHYFPDVTSCAYSIKPIFGNPADLPVGTGEQEKLIDIQTDETAKIKHKECNCPIKFLVEHGVIVRKPSHPGCFSIINFLVNVGLRVGVLGLNEHKIEKLEPLLLRLDMIFDAL